MNIKYQIKNKLQHYDYNRLKMNTWALHCFRILVVVRNAAMNTGVLMFFQISVLGSLDIFPEVEMLGQKADPFLIF